MGALLPCARPTSSTMRASAVSRPTAVARMTNVPVVLRVAPMTVMPGPTSTGIGSPVSMLVSTADDPASMTPSTGIRSPARTRSRSPTTTTSSGTSVSAPSGDSRRAVTACSPTSRRMAPVAPAFARASSQRPSRTRPRMIVDESKYVSGCRPASWIGSGKRVTTTL